MKFLLLTGWLLYNLAGYSQHQPTFHLHSLSNRGELLDKAWIFHAGDNPAWASPGYADLDWTAIDPTQDVVDLPTLWQSDRGWFRLHLSLDSALGKESLALLLQQTGASEVFINGKLIARFGYLSHEPKQVRAATPLFGELIPLPLQQSGEQVLAVRFALQKGMPYVKFADFTNPAVQMRVIKMRDVGSFIRRDSSSLDHFKMGLFFVLSLLHLALYWFYPVRKANLYFFIFAFLSGVQYFLYPWIFH